MGFLNKLEQKLGRFAIPGLMKYVIACYIIGYVIEYMAPHLYYYITLEPYMIFHAGQFWRLISWVLIPPSYSNIIFVVILIILYYQLGTALERTWGTFRFNAYIFGGVVLTIAGALILYGIYAALGISGSYGIGGGIGTYYINMTIFLAFAMCFPNMRILLYFIIPIKMKWMALVYAALFVYSMVQSGWAGRVAAIAALVNFLVFFLLTRDYKPYSPKELHRKRSYKKKVQSATMRPDGTTRHKCSICGRTEEDDPTLEFRFCSKCKGNHEYCQEHLFTHRHIE